MQKKLFFKLLLISIFIFTSSCGIYKYSDARKNPVNADERIKKNMEEGKGFRLGQLGGNKSGGDFQFATSNPMWRAAIAKLDFAPLNTVDYAGGIIITDWFGDGNSNDEIKLTIRFLTNEIRSDALDIKIFTKSCDNQNNCVTSEVSGNLNAELKKEILKRAVKYKEENPDKKKNPNKKSDPNKIFG